MDVEELFRKLRPVLGKRLDALWLEYESDRESRTEIEDLLRILAVRHLNTSAAGRRMLLPPPPATKSRGGYELGAVVYAGQNVGSFGLRENEWIQHVAIFGRSGSGKTNVGFLILRELLRHGKPVWVFDWKRNYRDLAHDAGLTVLTVGRRAAPFSFNPLLPPPGTEPGVWLKKLVEILAHAYGVRQASSYVLQRALFDLWDRSDGAVPTFGDLHNQLEGMRGSGRESQWIQSARRVVGTLCLGSVASVLNDSSIPLQNLLEQSVVFELDALTDTDKTFMIEALLLWVHQYRMQQPAREQFRHAMLIEEAHHVLLKRTQSHETVMDVVLREIRELGESVILIDQHPSLISVPSLGNTYCTIAMNLKHGSDIATLGTALRLGAELRDDLGRLPVGSAIVRLHGRWQRPFLVRFPKYDVKKGSIGDSDLRSTPGDSPSMADIRSGEAAGAAIRAVRTTDGASEDKRHSGKNAELLLKLIEDAVETPMCGVAGRYKRLGISADIGTKVKDEAIQMGLLRAARIRIGRRQLVGLVPTSLGLRALEEAGRRPDWATPDDRASPEHEFWKAWVFRGLRDRGVEVESEATLPNGHRTDLLITGDGRRAAIEIETGKSDVPRNIADLVDARMRVVLLATSMSAKAKISTQLRGEVAILVVGESLVQNPEQLIPLLFPPSGYREFVHP